MLFKFGMTDCKSVSTHLDQTVKLRPDAGKVCDPKRFRQIVRSLIYLTVTQPDLIYPVSSWRGQPRSTFSARNEY